MTEASEQIKALLLKHLKGELTPLESKELEDWVRSSPSHQAIYDQLSDPDQFIADLKEFDESRANIWAKIGAQINAVPAIDPRPSLIKKLSPYLAAASLIAAVICLFLWRSQRTDSPIAAPQSTADVVPGGNHATLTLSDGSTIPLDKVTDGHLARQAGANIIKSNNQLSYRISSVFDGSERQPGRHASAGGADAGVTGKNEKPVFNTLTTPKAGQFQVTLPDGTHVWLNNLSSLRYPVAFTDKGRREVFLDGEAYFDVVTDRTRPFVISQGGREIVALGTSFNIMSYKDEPAVKATLISGKMAVDIKGHRVVILAPGQQALIDAHDNTRVVDNIDTDEAIAWKRGYFHFIHAGIGDVLRQLARWYDVEVDNTIPEPTYTFDGEIGRDLTLMTILRHLEKPDLHFRVEGRHLIVSH